MYCNANTQACMSAAAQDVRTYTDPTLPHWGLTILLQVMESWQSILRGVRPNAFKITLEDVRVFALSETTGLVTCVEIVEADDSKGR